MNRLTAKQDGAYITTDPERCINRLGLLEDYVETLQQQLEGITRQMDRLSKQEKGKTATYQQLLANRSLLRNQLTQLSLFADIPLDESEQPPSGF